MRIYIFVLEYIFEVYFEFYIFYKFYKTHTTLNISTLHFLQNYDFCRKYV